MKFTERLYIGLQYLLPHHLMSRLARSVTRSEKPWIKTRLIHWAIRKFGINIGEALDENPDNYASFNAFFTRELKPEARPVDDSPSSIVSPCDGVISQLGRIKHDLIFQAKGQQYSINRLLASEHDRIKRFINGDFINIYLSPKDYHRLHMPVDGTLLSTTYVPGRLFSVAPLTTAHIPALCARNDRLICYFDTPAGLVAQILVGAVMVAGIESVWHGLYDKTREIVSESFEDSDALVLARGEEMGRFNMGSTIIMLFEKGRSRFLQEMVSETGLRMGQAIGEMTESSQP